MGAISNPKITNTNRIANRAIVILIYVLIAILWVLKTKIAIPKIAIIAIGIEIRYDNDIKKGKKMSIIVITKAKAEKVHVAMFATQKKNPVMKAEKPPIPSLLKE